MTDKSISYVVGFIVGIILVLVVSMIIMLIRKKAGKQNCNYDERQKAIQGKAGKIGFFVLSLYLVINGLVCMCVGNWLDTLEMNFVGICLGSVSYAGYAIINDAYISIQSKPSRYLMMFGIVAVINIGCYFINRFGGEPDEIFLTNFIAGAAFLVLFFVMLVKMLVDKHSAKKEME